MCTFLQKVCPDQRTAASLSAALTDEALQAPEPQGWEQRLDPKGGGYYYAHKTGTSKDAPAYAPNKLAGASESDTDEDEAVTYVGGSKQVASTPGKGTSDYYYAHKPENHVTKVDMPPQKLA